MMEECKAEYIKKIIGSVKKGGREKKRKDVGGKIKICKGKK